MVPCVREEMFDGTIEVVDGSAIRRLKKNSRVVGRTVKGRKAKGPEDLLGILGCIDLGEGA